MDLCFGKEGETFNYENGKPEYTSEVKGFLNNDINREEQVYGVAYTYWMLMDTAWKAQWGVNCPPYLEQPQMWTRPYAKFFAEYEDVFFALGSEVSANYDLIQRRWGKVLPKLIRAENENVFNSILDEFNQFKKDNGIEGIQKIQTELLKKNKKKLGL